MFKKKILIGCLAISILVLLVTGTMSAKAAKNAQVDEKKLSIVYQDSKIQPIDLNQGRNNVKALKNFKNKRQTLTIAYCDGAIQEVKLQQDVPDIKSYRFNCAGPTDDKRLNVVYYDGQVQFIDLKQSRGSVKALKNFKNKKQRLVIAFCDGKIQEVNLKQAKTQIKSYRFHCAGPTISDFGTTKPPKDGKEYFKGNIYYLDKNTKKLPDLKKLTPVGKIFTRHIDIPAQAFDKGFPGVTDRFEWFAIQYKGKFHFKRQKGVYKFRLLSDDGAKLYIDKKLVIDNDGIHGPSSKTGTVTLNSGTHHFRLDYFQGPRNMIALQLFVTPPDTGEEKIF